MAAYGLFPLNGFTGTSHMCIRILNNYSAESSTISYFIDKLA